MSASQRSCSSLAYPIIAAIIPRSRIWEPPDTPAPALPHRHDWRDREWTRPPCGRP